MVLVGRVGGMNLEEAGETIAPSVVGLEVYFSSFKLSVVVTYCRVLELVSWQYYYSTHGGGGGNDHSQCSGVKSFFFISNRRL